VPVVEFAEFAVPRVAPAAGLVFAPALAMDKRGREVDMLRRLADRLRQAAKVADGEAKCAPEETTSEMWPRRVEAPTKARRKASSAAARTDERA
jgi:hypothetical protein